MIFNYLLILTIFIAIGVWLYVLAQNRMNNMYKWDFEDYIMYGFLPLLLIFGIWMIVSIILVATLKPSLL